MLLILDCVIQNLQVSIIDASARAHVSKANKSETMHFQCLSFVLLEVEIEIEIGI